MSATKPRVTPREVEWHDYLVTIPMDPPRRLTARTWLAWLVHSKWTRATVYVAVLPVITAIIFLSQRRPLFGADGGFGDPWMKLLLAAPVVTAFLAAMDAQRFARLVSRGACAMTHARAVTEQTAIAEGTSHGVGVYSFPVSDVSFEYQGGRDGVDIQGVWRGRIRYMRQPSEGQTMPVLFDPRHPEQRIVLWQYGLKVSG